MTRYWNTAVGRGSVLVLVIGWISTANAQEQTLTVNPERVIKGTNPPVTLSLLKAPSGTDVGLAKAKSAIVAGQTAKFIGDPKPAEVTIAIPKLEITGRADVQLIGDKGVLATGELTYVDLARTNGGQNDVTETLLLVFGYVLLIVLFPLILMWVDIRKAYRFSQQSRDKLFEKFSVDKLSLEQLKILLPELNQPPPGIPGLARATIAFTLLMIIGVGVFHIVVVAPWFGKEIPPAIEKLLTLLAGALTSIISFYFGAKTAETAQKTAAAAQQPPETVQPPAPVLNVTPKRGQRGTDVVTLQGRGFGAAPGTVSFGNTQAAAGDIQSWSDTSITVKVPANAQQASCTITVTPQGRPPITGVANDFTVV